MSIDRPTLEEFVRHAERFGSELVYETALEFLSTRELGALSLALQRLDRRWRLEPLQRRRLAFALDREQVASSLLCEMSQISHRTLDRLRAEWAATPDPPEQGAGPAQPCGPTAPNRGPATTDTDQPKMAHSGRQKRRQTPTAAQTNDGVTGTVSR